MVEQGGFVVASLFQRDRLGGVEAMRRGEAVGGQAEQLHRDDGVAMQADHPLHGTQEALVQAAPAHALGRGQLVDGLDDQRGQDIRQWLAGFLATEHVIRALVRFDGVQRIDFDAAGACEAGDRFLRGLGGRSAAFDIAVGLAVCNIANQHGQAARRGEDTGLAGLHAQLGQAIAEALAQLLGHGLQRGGRQLFAAEFKQEICVHGFGIDQAASTACCSMGKPRASRAS